jgi:hypothetical protein
MLCACTALGERHRSPGCLLPPNTCHTACASPTCMYIEHTAVSVCMLPLSYQPHTVLPPVHSAPSPYPSSQLLLGLAAQAAPQAVLLPWLRVGQLQRAATPPWAALCGCRLPTCGPLMAGIAHVGGAPAEPGCNAAAVLALPL